MTKHKHHSHSGKVDRSNLEGLRRDEKGISSIGVNMTPGRAPAEGGEIGSPSHERWEQGTANRDPVEGPDMDI